VLSHKQLDDIFNEQKEAKIALLKLNIKISNIKRMKRKYFKIKRGAKC
jgi:hypothetical protein